MNLSDVLSRFPALWVVIGSLLTGVIGFLIARKAFALSSSAQDRLIDTLEKRCTALETERNEYRGSAHEYRNQCQAAELKLREAEARPDLTKLFESQQKEADRRYEVYTSQTQLIAKQSEVLAGVARMQEKLVADFEQHEKENAARQTAITALLQDICAAQAKTRRRARAKG